MKLTTQFTAIETPAILFTFIVATAIYEPDTNEAVGSSVTTVFSVPMLKAAASGVTSAFIRKKLAGVTQLG